MARKYASPTEKSAGVVLGYWCKYLIGCYLYLKLLLLGSSGLCLEVSTLIILCCRLGSNWLYEFGYNICSLLVSNFPLPPSCHKM